VSVPLLPPKDLASRTPEFVTLLQGAIIERFYTAAYDPIYFDRSSLGRFNAPDGSYGVLYAAEQLGGAFAETFLRTPGRTLLPPDLVRQKARARIRTTRELRLIRLAGSGLARLGATAEVAHGGLPYDVPQAWSKALKEHPTQPDGIAYRARHNDDAICYALFDHASSPVQEQSRDTNLDDQDWFWREAARYDIGLAPS
jgi:hypothetical protein